MPDGTKRSADPAASLLFTEQGVAPATPAAGEARMYRGDDGAWYGVDDAGSVAAVGGGGGRIIAAGDAATGTDIESTTIGKFGNPVAFTSNGGLIHVSGGGYIRGDAGHSLMLAVSNDDFSTAIVADPYSLPAQVLVASKIRTLSPGTYTVYGIDALFDGLTAGAWQVAFYKDSTGSTTFASYGSPIIVSEFPPLP